MESRALINIIDNLESDSSVDALSAKQGKVLKDLIDELSANGDSEDSNVGDVLNHADLNTLIDKVYVGYGHSLTNAPASAGYFVNIPNPNSINNYTRQFFMYYANNIVYTRYVNNGVFSAWAALNDKNIMTATLSDSISSTVGNAYTNMNLVSSCALGDKLTINNGGIKIGSGVSKVLISGNVKFVGRTASNKHIRVIKNTATVAWANVRTTEVNHEVSIAISPMLINVSEGDVLYLAYFAATGDGISNTYPATYLTVEAVG